MCADCLLDGIGEVVGSDRGALPGWFPVGFRGPPAEPGLPVSEHRAPRDHAVGIGPVGASGQGMGMLFPR